VKIPYDTTIQFGIDYGNRYCEGKLKFEDIAKFPTTRKILLGVYMAMVEAKQLTAIEYISGEDKTQLKTLSATFAPSLDKQQKIDFCKVVWVLAEIVDRFCIKHYKF
jgi:hypothetical protein